MGPSDPAVEFNLPPRHGVGALASVAAAGAAAGLVVWLAGPAPALDDGLRSVLGLLAAATLVPAVLGARRDPPCRLRHDGQGWAIAADAAEQPVWSEGELRVMFDLQSALLLRFMPAQGGGPWSARWIAIRRSDLAPRWHEWRCSVFAAARPGRQTPASRGGPTG